MILLIMIFLLSKLQQTVTQSKIDGIINICSGKPEKLANRVERFIKRK